MMYFFNFMHLFKIVLSSSIYHIKIHIELTHFVDKFNELYYSMAWASFIKSCFKEYVKNKNRIEIVLSSNCVYYRYL